MFDDKTAAATASYKESENKLLTDAKANKMKLMAISGYTLEEIAEATGFSPSTVAQYI